jgi:hypothetical protein
MGVGAMGVYMYPHPQTRPGIGAGPNIGLPGVAYSQKWTPTFFNQSAKAVNGASIDIGYSFTPLHTFELTYSFLRDVGPYPYSQAGYQAINYEFRRLLGFFLYIGGTRGRFAYDNEADDTVTGQRVGTGDGTTVSFQLTRSIGDLAASPFATEPIGFVDPQSAVIVYLSGTPVSSSTWNIINTAGLVQLVFTAAPGNNIPITIDMKYFYYCKFAEDISVFEKFTSVHWANPSVKLQSCRPGA